VEPNLARVVLWLQRNLRGDTEMSDETIDVVLEDMRAALRKQFVEKHDNKFKVRPSNIGRPLCQLQMEKAGAPSIDPDYNFLMRMVLGDIVEAVLKGVIREAGVPNYESSGRVTADVAGEQINGEYDLKIDGKVYDVKSCSDWAFKKKFESWGALKEDDAFGYVDQLHVYAKGHDNLPGGIWAVNIATGQINLIEALDTDVTQERRLQDLKNKIDKLKSDAPFERCFEDVEETFNKALTGNRKLGVTCSWCKYRFECWPTLQERESVFSKAKSKPMVSYTELNNIPEQEKAYA
jgi:hypothetical protein